MTPVCEEGRKLSVTSVTKAADPTFGQLRASVDGRGPVGATFVVELPIQITRSSAAPADHTPLPRSGRLLVVDDEVLVGEVLRGLLTKLGCDVVLARSAREARAILSRDRFDLIALDLLMPEESGADLWHDLHARMPKVAARVVFITGAADPALQCGPIRPA